MDDWKIDWKYLAGLFAIYALAWGLKRLRLWLKRVPYDTRLQEVIERGREAEKARLQSVTKKRGDAYTRAYQRIKADKSAPSVEIRVDGSEVVVTERPYGGGADISFHPYAPIDDVDIRRQRAIDEGEGNPRYRAKRQPATPFSFSEIISADKKRTNEREEWIRREALRLADENMEPEVRSRLLAEGGQPAVDKALQAAANDAVAKIDQQSKRLAGRLLNSENVIEDANLLKRGLDATERPLPPPGEP